jgi:hypothetical protein
MSLYKYATPERLDVLRHLRIRFTQPTALNDPFEFRPLVSAFRPPDLAARDLAAELERQLPQEIAKYKGILSPAQAALLPILANQLKPAMVGQAMEQIDAFFPTLKKSLFDTLGNSLGILSLSEIPDNPLMWAHYAANHTGFIIEFDDQHPWFSAKLAETDELRHLRKVSYVDTAPSSYLTEWKGQDVFCSKLKMWEYEQEWRIIRPLQEASERIGSDIYLFAVPPESIRSVIKGIKTASNVGAELSSILKGDPKLAHVRKSQAQLSASANLIEIIPAA